VLPGGFKPSGLQAFKAPTDSPEDCQCQVANLAQLHCPLPFFLWRAEGRYSDLQACLAAKEDDMAALKHAMEEVRPARCLVLLNSL
jgi:hypothetical protein